MATSCSYAEVFLAAVERTREASKTVLLGYGPQEDDGLNGDELTASVQEQAHSPWGGLNSYLTLIKDDDRFFGLVRPMYLVPTVLEERAAYHSRTLAFNGDVHGDNLPQAYVFPNQLLSVKTFTTPFKIPLWERAVQYAETHPDALFMPAVADDAAEGTYTVLTETRTGIYVPTPFAADLVLGDHRLTVREAVLKTENILKADGEDSSDYEIFTNWLLLAYVEGGRGQIQRSAPPSTPIYERALLDRLETVVKQDLPGWKLTAPPTAPPAAAAAPPPPPAEPSKEQEKKPKLPSECWPEAIDILMTVMGVEDEEELADVHHRMANCAKASERRTILKNMLRREAQRLGYDPVTATKELWESVAEFEYASSRGIDCLTHGIHPAMVAYTSDGAEVVKEERAKRALMRDGDLTATELEALQKSAKVQLPHTESQLRRTLEAFQVLLNVLHGDDELATYYHDKVIRNMRPILKALGSYARDPRYKKQNVYGGYVRSLQRMFFHYYEDMSFGTRRTRLPPFGTLLESMQIQTWVPPSMPHEYGEEEEESEPKGAGGGGNPKSNPSARVQNKEAHEALLSLGKRVGRNVTRFLTQIGPGNGVIASVPRMADGNQYCITWQCKGNCHKGCDRAEGHRALSDAELETLKVFLEDGCQKLGRS